MAINHRERTQGDLKMGAGSAVENSPNFTGSPNQLKIISVYKNHNMRTYMYVVLVGEGGYTCTYVLYLQYIVHTKIWVGGRLLRTFIIIWVAWPLIHFDIEKKMSHWGWNPFWRNICSYFFLHLIFHTKLLLNFHNLMPFFQHFN